MKNDNTQQCPKGINLLVDIVFDPSVAKGRKSRTRRLITTLVPGDRVVYKDDDGTIVFDLSVNCFMNVSTVLSR